MHEVLTDIIYLVLGLGGLALYFLPTIWASHKKHKQENAIAVLNLLLGWTVLGWVGALVWSAVESK